MTAAHRLQVTQREVGSVTAQDTRGHPCTQSAARFARRRIPLDGCRLAPYFLFLTALSSFRCLPFSGNLPRPTSTLCHLSL